MANVATNLETGIKGRLTTPGAGEIGEVIESISAPTSLTSNQFNDGGASITLTPGVWELETFVTFIAAASTTVSRLIVDVGSTVSGTATTGSSTDHRSQFSFNNTVVSANPISIVSRRLRVVVADGTTSTRYPKAFSIFGVSTMSVTIGVYAIRIA